MTAPEPLPLAAAIAAGLAVAGGEPGRVLIHTAQRTVFASSDDALIIKVDVDQHRQADEVSGIAFGSKYLPVPEVVAAVAGDPAVLVYRRIDGSALPGSGSQSWRGAGAALSRLHAGSWHCPTWHRTGWGDRQAETGMQYLDDLGIADDHYFRSALSAFTSDVLPQCVPLHGDAKPEHFLFRDGDLVGVIDWADFGCGDAIVDLVAVTRDEPLRLAEVLAGYQPTTELLARLRRLERPYRVRRQLGDAWWMAQLGQDPEPLLAAARAAG